MEKKNQKQEIENENKEVSSSKGCLYVVLIFLGVLGILIAVKILFF